MISAKAKQYKIVLQIYNKCIRNMQLSNRIDLNVNQQMVKQKQKWSEFHGDLENQTEEMFK